MKKLKNPMKQYISVKNQSKGFTLIELMIVISIIGILAAFAVPMFQDYIIRTRVGEGLSLASSAKTLVVENATNQISPLDTGWPGINSTVNTSRISVDGNNGVITVNSTVKAGGIELTLTPNGNTGALVAGVIPTGRVDWVCAETTGAVSKNRLPAECR